MTSNKQVQEFQTDARHRQILVVLLIDHAAWESEALPRSGPQYQISALISQMSFYRKPDVASQNVGCFLRLHCCHFRKNPDLCQMEHVPHT